jgi:hypothetical protein
VLAMWTVIHVGDDGSAAVWWLRLERGRVPLCGLWEFEAVPHAIERYFQRSPSADLTRALVEANDCVRAGRLYRH